MKVRFGVKRKRRYARNWIFCLLWVLCASVVQTSAQDFKTVASGVEYAQVSRIFSGHQVNMNLLRLDLTKVRLDVIHARDAAIGLEKTSSIAARHGAFAAINAGYFRLDDSIWAGDPAGTLMIDHELLSESQDERVALGIINGNANTAVYFGHPSFVPTIKGEKFTTIEVNGIDRERRTDEIVVYTPKFGQTTLTSRPGVEAIINKGRIVQMVTGGNSPIPVTGFVLSIEGSEAMSRIAHWKVGSKLALSTANLEPMYDFEPQMKEHQKLLERLLTFDLSIRFRLEDVTNGVPQLIKNGKIDITWEQEKTNKTFVETKHPRTAVAKLKDGRFLMITVDGRSESSGGISLTDLAAYLLELGATDAMNLDGGGSTTMFLDGKVVNHPSDKEGERKVSDAILVTLRRRGKKK